MIITVEIGLAQNQIRLERVVLEGRSHCTHWGREEQKVQKNSFDLRINSIEACH